MELLAGLPADDVQHVLRRARRRRFRRGDILFHEGDPADTLHLVAKGRFAIRVSTAAGDTVTIDLSGPGDVIGEQALIPPAAPRSATATALETSETMALSASDFAALRAEQPSVDDILLALLARRNRFLSARLVEALHVGADSRVLRRLLDAAAGYGATGGASVVPLTQDDLAGLAGTTRETVNRVLRREEERGAVTLGRGRITIVDRDQLERRAR